MRDLTTPDIVAASAALALAALALETCMDAPPPREAPGLIVANRPAPPAELVRDQWQARYVRPCHEFTPAEVYAASLP